MYIARHYLTEDERDPFQDWLKKMRDPVAKIRACNWVLERLASETCAMKDRSHDEAMAELFRDDPQFAAEYLNDLLLDGEPADLLVALRQIADAHGGIRAVAKETELNANQLYRTLSPQGNPELRSLFALLKALGLRLAIQPAHTRAG